MFDAAAVLRSNRDRRTLDWCGPVILRRLAQQSDVKMADPTRMSVLRMIRFMDADNTQIAGWLDVSRPSVSMHAKILADAGLISTTRQGRQARHVFHPDEVRQLCDELLRYLDVSGDTPGEEPSATDPRSAG